MTVFVAHAQSDQKVADDLEKFLERRGHFVELDDGHTALRPVARSDALVLLISKDFVFSPYRLRLEQRALDAWAEGRLVVAKLDHSFAPVGLRDLPTIDASFEARREFTWGDIADAVREKLRTVAPDERPPEEPQEPTRARKKSGGGGVGGLLWLLAALPGIGALVVTGSIWLANRIGPTPGTLEDLRYGVNQFGMRYGAPNGVTEWVFAAALLLTLFALGALVAGIVGGATKRGPKRAEAPPAPASEAAPAPEPSDAVFVSYARANQGAVLPVIDAAKQAGRRFWLDQQSVSSGDGWAGEIVKAIRGAKSVLVMCSKAAFESDHVKREIYLADRYHKKLLPVFIEEAAPPEDFEYFFADVQPLKLFETPEAERPEALMRVLGTA